MRSDSGVVAGTWPDSVQRLTIGVPSTKDQRYASRLPCASAGAQRRLRVAADRIHFLPVANDA